MPETQKPNGSNNCSNDSKRKGVSLSTVLNGLRVLRFSVTIFLIIEFANLLYMGSIWDDISKNSINSTQLNTFLNIEGTINLIFTLLVMIIFVTGEYFTIKLKKFAE
jgi:hypothetical protein